jgi:diketogulonate reductase-like aldo/keto reductase
MMNTPGSNRDNPSAAKGVASRVKLSHGGHLPWLGLGVYQIDGDKETAKIVRQAIQLGYRSIDTASLYGNEGGVGEAVATSGVSREELFITTKVWNDDMRRDRVESAFEESLKKLRLEYVDLYLLHWPIAGKIAQSWRVLEKIQRSGRAKAIGVSNYMIPHLDELLGTAEIVPAVNQIEFHPYLQSKDLHQHCRMRGIQLEAWSPLMQAGPILRDPVLTGIALKYGKTTAQVILRWDVQSGVVTIPKSVKPQRLAENAAIFDFVLTEAEMAAVDSLDRNQRSGADPFHFGF